MAAEPMSLKEKLAYWRKNGAFGVTYQGGQYRFHEDTNKGFADREIAMAAADGREIVPVDKNGDRYD